MRRAGPVLVIAFVGVDRLRRGARETDDGVGDVMSVAVNVLPRDAGSPAQVLERTESPRYPFATARTISAVKSEVSSPPPGLARWRQRR
jgi:hypothetical protein